MSLFQKKPIAGTSLPIYSIGEHKTVLFVGLGNPGKEFKGSRHNIGFEALEHFAEKNEFPMWIHKKDFRCDTTSLTLGSTRVILCKPMTFMNLSGEAARAIQDFYKMTNKETVAVYDELAIPFGQIRARVGGESAGHNGVKSLIQHMGEDFGRIRIGISNELSQNADAEDFVLGKFTKQEQGHLPLLLQEVNAMLTEYIFGGALPHDTRSIL
jgi:PTH1 family peptidyl-tRNA hydrolase